VYVTSSFEPWKVVVLTNKSFEEMSFMKYFT
jgi:hypothetical protein